MSTTATAVFAPTITEINSEDQLARVARAEARVLAAREVASEGYAAGVRDALAQAHEFGVSAGRRAIRKRLTEALDLNALLGDPGFQIETE